MLDKYSILQSGFLSLGNPKLTRPTEQPSDMSFDAYILNKSFNIDTNVYFFHSALDHLYKEYKKDQRLSLDFDFREKVFIEFYDAIGMSTLEAWIDIQVNNPNLSVLHSKFLIDMLMFISGRTRTIQPENWELIISKDNSFNKSPFVKIKTSEFFNRDKGLIPGPIDEVLLDWISKPMGFSDFIVTIGIIFGRKNGVETVI